MAEIMDVDYLIVGAGAMGLAFADTMLSDSKATMAIVDRYHAPAGTGPSPIPSSTFTSPLPFTESTPRPSAATRSTSMA